MDIFEDILLRPCEPQQAGAHWCTREFTYRGHVLTSADDPYDRRFACKFPELAREASLRSSIQLWGDSWLEAWDGVYVVCGEGEALVFVVRDATLAGEFLPRGWWYII